MFAGNIPCGTRIQLSPSCFDFVDIRETSFNYSFKWQQTVRSRVQLNTHWIPRNMMFYENDRLYKTRKTRLNKYRIYWSTASPVLFGHLCLLLALWLLKSSLRSKKKRLFCAIFAICYNKRIRVLFALNNLDNIKWMASFAFKSLRRNEREI